MKSIEHEQLKNKIPDLKVGNTVRVHVRIKEGNKERIQVFEGIIIKVQGSGVNKTFTVRKISYGVGVEKTFLIHSPLVEKVELTRVGHARRAKLFYLRDRIGKAAKTKEVAGARIENKEIEIKSEKTIEVPVEGAPEDNVEVVAEEAVVEEVLENPQEFGIPEWLLNRRIDYATGETTHLIESDLDMTLRDDLNRMKMIRSYKGKRHEVGLPVRGQRTKSTFRHGSSRGNRY